MALRVRVPCTRFLSVEERSSADVAPRRLQGVGSVYVLRLLYPNPHDLPVLRGSTASGVDNVLGQAHLRVYRSFNAWDASVPICHIEVRDFRPLASLQRPEHATLPTGASAT